MGGVTHSARARGLVYRGAVPVLALGFMLAGVSAARAAPPDVAAKLADVRAPSGQLQPARTIRLPGGGAIYRYRQELGGVPVLDGEAVVSDPPGGPPSLVADATAHGLSRPTGPRIGRDQAIATARAATRTNALRGQVAAGQVITRAKGGTLAWRVDLPSAQPLGDFQVLVDAASGRVLANDDLLSEYQTGTAMIFNPNPVVTNGSWTGLTSDQADQDTPLLTSLRLPVTLHRIKKHQHCLKGKYAEAELYASGERVCRHSLNWNGVTRSNDRFEALMAYFHMDRTQAYIHELGFSDATRNGANDRRQVALADSLSIDNSFFSPFTHQIRFGTGGVDDAEDADVVIHEYGHAVQFDQSPAFLRSSRLDPGSLQEGSADYLAGVMSTQSPDATHENEICLAEWDSISYTPVGQTPHCLRRLDNQETLNQAKHDPDCRLLTGPQGLDIHCIGTVWSGALWNLRQTIPAGEMDRIYLTAQFMYTGDETFSDAGKALVKANAALGFADKAQNKNEICGEMAARGINVPNC